jgi:hypothetical protein
MIRAGDSGTEDTVENKTVPENPLEHSRVGSSDKPSNPELVELPTAAARTEDTDSSLEGNDPSSQRMPKAAIIDSQALIQAARDAGLDSLLPPEENPQTVPLPDIELAHLNEILDAPGSSPQLVRRFVNLLRTIALRNIEVVRKYGSRIATTLGRWIAQGLTRLELVLRRSDAAVIIFTLAMVVGCIVLTLLAVWVWNTY